MNSSLNRVRVALIFASLMLVALVFGLSREGAQTATASPSTSPASAPNETWQNPVNISNLGGIQDLSSAVAASPLNDAVTVAWESRDHLGASYDHVVENSNTTLGLANLTGVTILSSVGACCPRLGSARTADDGLGKRHMVWWKTDENGTCGWYARVDADGVARDTQIVPGSCGAGKNTALAASPNGTVHAFFGVNGSSLSYFRREANGVWSVQGESVPGTSTPKDLNAAATSNGDVMVTYGDGGPVHSTDVHVSMRSEATGTWGPSENLSAPVCQNNSASAHLPWLAADRAGNMRIAWTQANCAQSAAQDDVYYREWTAAGGWGGEIRQITNNTGNSYNVVMAVDGTGKAHIVWADGTRKGGGNFEMMYSNGQGTCATCFTSPESLFGSNFPDTAFQKEPSMDSGLSAVHLSFSSSYPDSEKDIYYTYAPTTPPPTSTPAVTPTPCSLGNYSDVHTTDFFYQAVHDLSLRSIMSGYSDCTFRPFNNLTRGQAAKIVVLGANVPFYTPPAPTFRDIPATDAFYLHIESAYHAGVISGYSCGTGCLEFRGGNLITRGQFAKMIALAFPLTAFTPNTPTFKDVAATSPFYQYIETVAHYTIVSGYSCGGTGEPCPGLYFRPNNNITRGQAAKIVFNARAVADATATATPVVVTATYTPTIFVITATPTNTPVVVTSTPTSVPTFTRTATPTSAAASTSTATVTATSTP